MSDPFVASVMSIFDVQIREVGDNIEAHSLDLDDLGRRYNTGLHVPRLKRRQPGKRQADLKKANILVVVDIPAPQRFPPSIDRITAERDKMLARIIIHYEKCAMVAGHEDKPLT